MSLLVFNKSVEDPDVELITEGSPFHPSSALGISSASFAGSVMEYISLFAADTHVDKLRRLVSERPPQDTSLELKLPEGVLIGQDLTVKAVLRKTCPEARSINLSMNCHSMYYTGVKARKVLQTVDFVDLKGEESGKSLVSTGFSLHSITIVTKWLRC